MRYKRYVNCVAPAAVLCMPIAPESASAEPLAAEQSQSYVHSEDKLLMPGKEKICKVLQESGVITRENAEAIIAAPVELSDFPYGIRVNYKNGQIVFGSNSAIMANFQQRYDGKENATMRAAEEYIKELAGAIGEADMILRTIGGSSVKIALISDWSDCVEVSVQNLILKKNISLKEAMDWFARTCSFSMIQKYVEWDEATKVFRINDDAFDSDFGE